MGLICSARRRFITTAMGSTFPGSPVRRRFSRRRRRRMVRRFNACGMRRSRRGSAPSPTLWRCVRFTSGRGLDELLIMPQMGSNVRHEDAMASLELIGTQVIPQLHARHEASEPARQKRKAELAAKAVARRSEAPRKADPDYRVNPIVSGISRTIEDLAMGREHRVKEYAEDTDR